MVALACSSGSEAPTDDGDLPSDPPPVIQASPLVGSWMAVPPEGEGEIAAVRMAFAGDGGLIVTEVLAGGGQLRFSGTWTASEDSLRLVGAYFEPADGARAAFSTQGDSLLVLVDEWGNRQEWRRL